MTTRPKYLHPSLPDNTVLVQFGEAPSRHVLLPESKRSKYLTWCHLFANNDINNLRMHEAMGENDGGLPMCGGCMRTLPAQLAALEKEG